MTTLEYTVEYRQDEETEMFETCNENCYYEAADDATMMMMMLTMSN